MHGSTNADGTEVATDEYDIGFFLKRCRILETRYGDRYYHLDRYAALRGY